MSRKEAQPWQDRSWPSWACWSLMPDYEATQKGHLLETYKVDPIYPLKGPRLSESAEKQPISSFKSRRVYFADTSRRLEIADLSLGGRVWRRITVIAGGDKDGMVGIRFCVSQSGYVGVNRLWEFECWLQLSWRQRHTPNSHLHQLSWRCTHLWTILVPANSLTTHSLCCSTQIHIYRSQGEGQKICKTTLLQTTWINNRAQLCASAAVRPWCVRFNSLLNPLLPARNQLLPCTVLHWRDQACITYDQHHH